MVEKFDPSLLPKRPNLQFENLLWENGVHDVAGIDEAGRGALAGPVAAAAVILPPGAEIASRLNGVHDSKQLSPAKRNFWAACIRSEVLAYGVGLASHLEIDAYGIVPATRLAVQRAVDNLAFPPQHLLLDFLALPECSTPQTLLVKGDARCLSIAAASILAKTTRDAYMTDLDRAYPGYGFAIHKGYGTYAHRRALQMLGPSPVHRRSFKWQNLEEA